MKLSLGLIGPACKRANVQTCKRANVQACKRASVQACKRASVAVNRFPVKVPNRLF